MNLIKLLDLKASGIHVAEYLLEIPPLEVFQRKIQEIVKRTKERLAIEGKVFLKIPVDFKN
ncbi:MAG TPA: hypothetical protein VMW10_13185 [Alphaproteobacteria bacterium]|nr:hypothetical protein [Alphaproteobacteria bacterium]